MTTFIIAALTADGLIAKNLEAPSTDWTSKEDKEFFTRRTKEAGVVVMGQNTYETIGRPLKDRFNIVYSKDRQYEGVEVTQKEPRELIEDLEKRGYKEVAICGGATIYTMFMEAGVVDKLYLTITSVVFGSGMNLFNKELDKHLELVSVEKLGPQTILLEYNAIK
ncbi:MAG: dihydrofolate reductase family protein [Patescibacteria group bacterium]